MSSEPKQVFACDNEACLFYGLVALDDPGVSFCARCHTVRVHVGYLVPVDESANHVTVELDKP